MKRPAGAKRLGAQLIETAAARYRSSHRAPRLAQRKSRGGSEQRDHSGRWVCIF
jgi:hypothetical protein